MGSECLPNITPCGLSQSAHFPEQVTETLSQGSSCPKSLHEAVHVFGVYVAEQSVLEGSDPLTPSEVAGALSSEGWERGKATLRDNLRVWGWEQVALRSCTHLLSPSNDKGVHLLCGQLP